MADQLVEVRASAAADSAALAALHRDAWRHAYRGIIPGIALERMVSRRGPGWWRRLHDGGGCVLVVDLGSAPAGYAMLGPARRGATGTGTGTAIGAGEIYELYLRPECQGIGLGRRLFQASRQRLRERGRPRLVVWALAENTMACRFYRAMHGTEFARSTETVGGVRLRKIGFVWP
jgi:ribosomal protein S18 acetylase RimI-like enzyme